MQVRLTNQPKDKQELLRALETFAAEHHLPAKVVQAADLALEEHVTNIMHYAYEDAKTHEILIRMEVRGETFEAEIDDDGKEFNPLNQPSPDLSLPLEERPIGGLGIHLMRQFMDELSYRREGGRNILTMRKRLGEKPAS